MRLVRSSLLLVLVLLAVSLPSLARAAGTGVNVIPQDPNADILIKLFYLNDGVDPNDEAAIRKPENWTEFTGDPVVEPWYFNDGRCTCDVPIRIVLRRNKLQNISAGSGTLYSGVNCGDVSNQADRDNHCALLGTFQASEFMSNSDLVFDKFREPTHNWFTIRRLMFPTGTTDAAKGTCISAQSLTTDLFALIQNGNVTTFTSKSNKTVNIDTQPPPKVTEYKVLGSEDGLALSWTVDNASAQDIYYYQALCSRENGMPLRDTPIDGSQVYFVESCPLGGPTPTPDAGVPTPDAGAHDAGGPMSTFVPAAADADITEPDAGGPTGAEPGIEAKYLCGTASKGSSGMSISLPSDVVIPNGEKINVRLLVIDHSGNYVDMGTQSAASQPVQDFWETYNNLGGDAEGGFCFVATAAYGNYDHPFVLVLRDFRDHTLAKFGAGRAFIRWYYRNSPPLADFIRRHETARIAAQIVLWPIVVLAGTWEYTGVLDKLALFAVFAFLIAWRRRRKAARRIAAAAVSASEAAPAKPSRARALAAGAAAILLVLCTSHIASAQPVYDDQLDLETEQPAHPPAWVFELKIGPYYPDVDGEGGFTASPGPYERMFRTRKVAMTQIELDRFFIYPGGQLGVAAGMGYFQRTTRSFAQLPNGQPNYDERALADTTSFHLMPFTVGAVYRFTGLADNTVVPVVPYAKLGLEYGLWWIDKTNGLADLGGNKGKALGGTLGWNTAIGLSLRVDAFDPGAARNMQIEMGVQHVGFFAELSYADVSGFGEAHKMHVGDATWSAGMNFEF